jgi:hypothetical protein
MKFILDSQSFDTATSSIVAVSRGVHRPNNSGFDERGSAEEVRFERVMYRTVSGTLYVHYQETYKFANGKPIVRHAAEKIDQRMAIAWIQRQGAALVDETGLSPPTILGGEHDE